MKPRSFLAATLSGLLLVLPSPAAAQPTDKAVKAAFLPRFFRYATWPPAAMPRGSDPFVLCVIGDDPFGASLDDAARSQSVDGRRIIVRRTASADGCQIAFLAGGRGGSPAQLIDGVGRKPVLTVTDDAQGHRRGIIHFTIVGGRVRFFIDQAAASQRGIQLSSRLLALALAVHQ